MFKLVIREWFMHDSPSTHEFVRIGRTQIAHRAYACQVLGQKTSLGTFAMAAMPTVDRVTLTAEFLELWSAARLRVQLFHCEPVVCCRAVPTRGCRTGLRAL